MSDEDLFSAVETLEGQHTQRGVEQGEVEGRRRQYGDGYSKGWQQACHLLQELGTLRGVVEGLLLEGGGEEETSEGAAGGGEQWSDGSGDCTVERVKPQPLDPKVRASLEKLLSQLEDYELWFKLGTSSDEKLAQQLSSLQAKARFTLRKLNIPMHVIDRTPDAEF